MINEILLNRSNIVIIKYLLVLFHFKMKMRKRTKIVAANDGSIRKRALIGI